MKAIGNGKIVMPDGVVEGKYLRFGETVVEIASAPRPGDDMIDAQGRYVIPGLFDMHTHGGVGVDASDCTKDELEKLSRAKLSDGVTSYLPTTVTLAHETLAPVLEMVRAYMREHRGGARVLGVNVEGPYLNPARKGAHDETLIRPADPDFLLPYADVAKITTIAPEMPGNLDAVRRIAPKIRVSLGHSAATLEEAEAGFAAGATHVTHLFNAMNPLHHRKPGLLGAALSSDTAYTELICDTFHVNGALFPLVRKAKGDRVVLITDATSAAGLGDGEYNLGGLRFTVSGIQCLLPDGTIAGSILRLNKGVDNYRKLGRATLWEAVNAASLNPARALGLDDTIGSLLPGRRGDVAIADEDMNIFEVYQSGEIACRKA